MLKNIFSSSHALITNLTENIREALDERYIGWSIFADLQCLKIDHEILLLKLYYYGTCGISNN